MLSAQDLDILAVQEVRFEAGDHTHNEMADLAGFLPDYQVLSLSPSLFLSLSLSHTHTHTLSLSPLSLAVTCVLMGLNVSQLCVVS